MNIRKKMLVSGVAASIILTSITGMVFSTESSDDVQTLDNGVKIKILKEKATGSITEELINSIWGSLDEFNKEGGYFLEGDISYIGVKNDSKIEELKKLNYEKGMPSNIRPYKINYSRNELEEVKGEIQNLLSSYGIEAYSVELDIKKQAVVVEAPIVSDENIEALQSKFGDRIKIVTNYEFKDFEAKDFADVTSSDWYYDAVMFLRVKGVTAGNRENEFLPDERITRQDAMAMTYRALAAVSIYKKTPELGRVFTDQGEISPYADKAIKYFESIGSISGYPDGGIHPVENITRSESAVFLSRVFSYKLNPNAPQGILGFADVNPEAYYTRSIEILANAGVIQQLSVDFRPDEDITRAEFASFLYRVCK